MQKKRAVALLRVSDDDQVDGFSLSAQQREFHRFCEPNDLESVQVASEEGVSAWVDTVDKRPILQQLLRDAEEGKYDVLVTHTIDRLSRNVHVLLEVMRVFDANGITYRCITTDMDFTTPGGRLFLLMSGGFAQFSSDNQSVHIRKGMREKAEQGFQNGSPPFGYARCDDCKGKDGDHPGVHVVSHNAEIVVEGYQLYATGGESLRTIATRFNSRGFRTAKGNFFQNWAIGDILANRFNIGEVRYHQQFFKGKHRPIVSPELFDAVQARLKKNRSRRSNSVNQLGRHAYLLVGLLRCSECGTTLWSQKQGSYSTSYYKVPLENSNSATCRFSGKSFVARPIDGQANKLFRGFSLRPDWREWVVAGVEMSDEDREAETRWKQGRSRFRLAQKEYIEGRLGESDFQPYKETYEASEVIYRSTLAKSEDVVGAAEMLEQFGTLWDAIDDDQRNRLLKDVLEAMYINLETREIVGLLPKPEFITPLLAMVERTDVKILDRRTDIEGTDARDKSDGMVETGEGRTPRPEDSPTRTSTSLAGT